MNELFSIITELLHTEACVVVPDFGGFVVNRKSASVDAASGLFCPPSVQVVFNPKLNHNDGLLLQAWATRHNCTMAEATNAVMAEVERLKFQLTSRNTLFIADFGTFSVCGSSYSFVSAINQDGFGENFGLQQFYLSKLNDEKATKAHRRKMVSVGVAAAALAAVMFFPISTSESNNLASFLPLSQETFKAGNTLNFVSMAAQQVNSSAHMLKTETKGECQMLAGEGRYYVALQQFPSVADANAFADKWQSRLSDSLSVVKVNNQLYAVACASTGDADMAARMMDNVRNNSTFKGTFILYK